jgi:hypothetical protein
MADEDTVWFPCKVDWWLAALLCIPPISGIVVFVSLATKGAVLVGLIPFALVVLLYVGVGFPIHYGISHEELIVRFGLARARVALEKIISVVPTRNPLSAPALSLSRLEIRWGEGVFEATMVSPKDRQGFLDLLADRAGLTRDGDSLKR